MVLKRDEADVLTATTHLPRTELDRLLLSLIGQEPCSAAIKSVESKLVPRSSLAQALNDLASGTPIVASVDPTADPFAERTTTALIAVITLILGAKQGRGDVVGDAEVESNI